MPLKRFFKKTGKWFSDAYRWIKGLTKDDIKNYSLNIISIVLIVSMFSLTLLSGGDGIFSVIDPLGSGKIVQNIRNLELNMTSIIYVKNSNGKWKEYKRVHGNENRIWVSLKKIPENLQNAFIAIEDEKFRNHGGVNWQRTFLALANQVAKFSSVEFGGSTITQQLVKNITSDNSLDYKRKLREIARALSIENELSKDEIMEAYLNTIALGNGINGVQVAANYYFGKDVSKLTLAECASIAAITKNPSRYNPIGNMKNNEHRRGVVLKQMYNLGHITKKEYYEAVEENVKLDLSKKQHLDDEVNNYFVDTLIEDVIADLAKKYKCEKKIASQMFYNGGFRIYSTVNPEIQSVMEDTYKHESRYFYESRTNNGERELVQSAMTVMDYKGHIVGIIGGRGEKKVNLGLNRAYDVPRQPGSTMKPIGVYALAIENDYYDYTSTVLDEPIKNYPTYGKYGPNEWFGSYLGNVPLNYALRHSMNAVPVRILKEMGVDASYKFLTKKLKLKHLTKSDKNFSALALGGCNYGITPTESAAAFAIFGNGGMYYEPTTYYKVVDVNGKVILEPNKGKRAIGEDTATIMNHLLQEVVYGSGGTGNAISGYSYRMKAYAKTGTTSETKDSWLVGGTPYYIGSVWYGFDHNYRVYNTNAAKSIWRDVMKKIHDNLPTKEFIDSEDVYKSGNGYYKNGTTPGKSMGEDEYKHDEEESSEESSTKEESTVTSTTSGSSSSEITSSEVTSSNAESSDTSSQESGSDESSGTSSDTSSDQSGTEPTESDTSTSEQTSTEPTG